MPAPPFCLALCALAAATAATAAAAPPAAAACAAAANAQTADAARRWQLYERCLEESDPGDLDPDLLAAAAAAALHVGDHAACAALAGSAARFEARPAAHHLFGHLELKSQCLHLDGRHGAAREVRRAAAAAGVLPSGDPRRPGGGVIYLQRLAARRFWDRADLRPRQQALWDALVGDDGGAAASAGRSIRRQVLARRHLLPVTQEVDRLVSLRRPGHHQYAWGEVVFYDKGHRYDAACVAVPAVCEFVDAFPGEMDAGAVKLSIMQPGTRVVPHAGSSNAIVRGHFGVAVPPEMQQQRRSKSRRRQRRRPHKFGLVVGGKRVARPWSNGSMIVFDDVFLHSVRVNPRLRGERVVLIVDLWHPGADTALRDEIRAGRLLVPRTSVDGRGAAAPPMLVVEQPRHTP